MSREHLQLDAELLQKFDADTFEEGGCGPVDDRQYWAWPPGLHGGVIFLDAKRITDNDGVVSYDSPIVVRPDGNFGGWIGHLKEGRWHKIWSCNPIRVDLNSYHNHKLNADIAMIFVLLDELFKCQSTN